MSKFRRITASIAPPAGADDSWAPPESLEWMPAGTHTVTPVGPDGRPETITITATEADAIALDMQLQALIASASTGESSRPFVDFDHEAKEAAAIPVKFFWQEGIRLAVDWTSRGLEALKGRVYSYFSPEFGFKEGRPVSLPLFGPIGALVNTPAFQSIERLAASMPPEGPASETEQKGKPMESLLAKLTEAGLIEKTETPMTEDQLVSVLSALKASVFGMAGEVKECNAKLATAETKLSEFVEATAEIEVSAAITAGKVDEKAKDVFKASFKADPKACRAMLGSIKGGKSAMGHNPNDLPDGKRGETEVTGLARAIKARQAQVNARN